MYTNEQLEAVSDFVTALQFVASRPNVEMVKRHKYMPEYHNAYTAAIHLRLGFPIGVCAAGAVCALNPVSPVIEMAARVYQDRYDEQFANDNDTHGWEYVRDRMVMILMQAELDLIDKELRDADNLAGGVGLGN